jgi:hypothetical protein
MKTKTLIFLVILSALASCSHRTGKNDEVSKMELLPDTTFSELSDSSFVPSHVKCVDTYGGDLYFSAYSGELVVLDADLHLKRRFGSSGGGPGEFLGAAHFYIGKDDSIHILNDGKHAFELFVGGKHAKHIPFPQEAALSNNTRFFVENGSIFHSAISDNHPVVVFDEKSNINRFICDYTTWDRPDFKHHSTRHLVKGDKCFFVSGLTLPVFQKYSLDGKLIMKYDLEKIPEIKKTVKRYKNTPQVPNTYFVMVHDIYYRNGKVYLLVGTNDPKYSCNTICVLDVSDAIIHSASFRLSGIVYESFCVTENHNLIAYNAVTAEIEVFTLPDLGESLNK